MYNIQTQTNHCSLSLHLLFHHHTSSIISKPTSPFNHFHQTHTPTQTTHAYQCPLSIFLSTFSSKIASTIIPMIISLATVKTEKLSVGILTDQSHIRKVSFKLMIKCFPQMIKLMFLAALAALYQSFRIGSMKLGDVRSDWPALSDVRRGT